MKRFHKLTAWVLTLAMLMTFIPTFSQMGTDLTVYAVEGTGSDSDDSESGGGTGGGGGEAGSGGSSGTEGDGTEVSYLAPVYEDGKIKFDANNDVVFETKTVTDYIVVEDIAYGGTITSADQMPTVGTSGDTTWYLADSDIEWENFVLVQGDVHLIICDDITITSLYGLVVSEGNSLTIYGQENGTGTLVAKGVNYSGGFYSAAIGGCDVTTEMANGGAITINGGIISASASPNAAAIGGSKRGTGGTITINGGSVDAKGAAYSAAIGGGSGGNSGNITINGGIVSAETSGYSSAIGAGYVMYSSTGESILAKTDKIEINGGTVVATHTDSYKEYPVIGGLYGFDNINISGGHITVNHARSGGIGIGTNSVTVMEFDGNLNISGSTIISGNDKTLYLGAGKTSSSAKGTVDVIVTGGNISGTFKNVSTLKDGENDVEMKEITIDGAEDQTKVTVLEDYPTYGLRDVVTYGNQIVIYVPASETYTVNISESIENGTVVADVTEAFEGDTVTLTVTPDEGYVLDTLTVDGTNVTASVTDNKYTFPMPANAVEITATFRVYHRVVATSGSVTVKRTADTVFPVTDGGSYSFTVEINPGYEKTAAFTVKAGNMADDAATYSALTPDGDGIYTITNITADQKIVVEGVVLIKPDGPEDFKEGGAYPFKLVCDGDSSHDIIAPYYDSDYVTDIAATDSVVVYEITFDMAKYLSDKLPEHRKVSNISSGMSFRIKWNSEVSKWEYLDGTKELHVSCAPETYTVRINSTISNGMVTADKTQAAAGETVTLTVTPDTGYELSSIAVYQSGTKVDINSDNTFIMPAGNVTVNATFKLSHVHTWTYQLYGTSTVRATCGGVGQCDSTANKSVTIVAPTLTEYGGTGSNEATVRGGTSIGNINLLPDIVYYEKIGDYWNYLGSTAPSTPGTYKAELTVDTVSAFVEYTIAQQNNINPMTPVTISDITSAGFKVTVAEADRDKNLEYHINDSEYRNVKLSSDGSFILLLDSSLAGTEIIFYIREAATEYIKAGNTYSSRVQLLPTSTIEAKWGEDADKLNSSGTLAAALAAKPAYIRLQANAHLSQGNSIDFTTTIDLNGYAVNAVTLNNAGNLTITGDGSYNGRIENNGTLIIDANIGGDVESYSGKVTVTDGKIQSLTVHNGCETVLKAGIFNILKFIIKSDSLSSATFQGKLYKLLAYGKKYSHDNITYKRYSYDPNEGLRENLMYGNIGHVWFDGTVSVLEDEPVVPDISTQPADASYPRNSAATVSVTATNGDDGGILSYQWYSENDGDAANGTAITGATGATYAPPTDIEGITYYYCVVTNSKSGYAPKSVTSNAAKITVEALSHTCNLTYTATGSTITAVCQTANCPETGARTIVISASDKDYDGKAATATVTNNVDSTDYSANIVYEAKTGSLTEGKAVKVGTYTASITLGDATAQVTFEIKPAPVVTSIDFNRESPAYDEGSNTFYVSDDFPFYLTVTGEYLTMLQSAGGLNAAFFGDTQNAGGTWMGMTIDSDISAHGSYNTNSLTYAINNAGGGSTYIKSIKVGDKWLNVNLKYADLYKLKINGSENGSVSHDHTLGDKIPENVEVTLKVSPNAGYEFETLIVDGQNVTAQVSGGKYTFTMPAKDVEVSATFKALPHTHDWEFAANGNVITATCVGTLGVCPNSTSTVTLVSPENLVYNRSEKVVTTRGTIDGITIPDVQYEGDRVNVGTFTAKLTIDNATATLAVTITPKSISGAVIVLDNNANLVYTENAITPDVTSVTLDGATLVKDADYTVSYSDNINAGQATVTVTGKGNYKDTANANFTIEKATSVVTAPTAKAGLTYTDQAYELVNAGNTTGGTMQYSLDNVTYSANIPTATNAGTYTVYYKVAGGNNYNDAAASSVEVTIGKQTVNKPAIESKEYTGTELTADVPANELYTVSQEPKTYVGEYDVTLTLKDNTNYKWVDTENASVTLKFNITATTNSWKTEPSISGWTFGPIASIPVYEAKFGIVMVEYKKAEESAYTTTAPTNAGNYTARFSVAATNNYGALEKTVDFTIKQLPVNITWENADGLVYDGTPKTITAVLANKVAGDNVNLTVEGVTSAIEKGTYTATVTAVDNGNYTITNGTNLTKEWAISETANEWTSALSITGWTFGDNANAPTATAKFGTVEFTYADSIDGAFTDTVPTNAGTYYVKATVAGTASYAEISATAQFIIEAKELNANNITAIEAETYTGEEIKPVLEVKDGDTTLVLGTDYEVTYQNNVNAGTAKAVVTFKGNYKGNAEKEFTILKKQIDPAITLTAPVKNTAPQTEITGTGYTATVVWSPDVTDKFGYNTEYTATITITVDENHTVTGIAANGYTVEGAKTVTNDENSNVVTVAYEKTGSRPSSGGGTTRYTVKFDTDDGSNVASKTVTRNSKVAEPTAPTKDGFTFEGWYTDKELTTAYDFDTKVTKSFTLYAKWNETRTEDDNKPGTSGHNCPSLKFSDLDITQWYHFDTDYVIENDIFRGTTETTFTPNGNITRAMMITVLYRAEGEPEVAGETTFEDVDENAYYANAVVWGQQNGIIKGYSETEYAPEQDILREQIAAIMHRYAQYKGYDVSVGENTNILSYDDFDSISEYAIPSMQWAVGSGMIKGRTESTLNPDAFATRVEIAAMLHRFIEANK